MRFCSITIYGLTSESTGTSMFFEMFSFDEEWDGLTSKYLSFHDDTTIAHSRVKGIKPSEEWITDVYKWKQCFPHLVGLK